jgi:hypothetical protein
MREQYGSAVRGSGESGGATPCYLLRACLTHQMSRFLSHRGRETVHSPRKSTVVTSPTRGALAAASPLLAHGLAYPAAGSPLSLNLPVAQSNPWDTKSR